MCATYGWGRNTIAAIAPGGATVAFATSSGHLEVRRWSDGADLGINNGFSGATAVAFSPDGALVGAATSDGVKIWRVSDATLLSTIPELANASALAISADGTVAVARTPIGEIKIARSGGVLTIAQNRNVGLGLSPDGTQVATVDTRPYSSTYTEYQDSLWRVSDGQSVWSVTRGRFPLFSQAHVVFSPDGTKVAVGGGYPSMLRMSDGRSLYLTSEPAAFSADSLAFLSLGDSDRQYTLMRASDGATVRSFNVAAADRIMAGAFGTGLAMRVVFQPSQAGVPASEGSTQTLAEDGVVGQRFTRINVGSAVLSPDGSLLAIRQSDGYIVIRDAASLAELSSRSGARIAFSPDSARAAFFGGPGVGIFTRAGLTMTNPNPSFSLATTALSIAFSPNATLIATGSSDHTATLWSGSDGSSQRTLWNVNGHLASVNGVAFSPDGTVVATAGGDHIIKLWRAADGTDLRTINTSLSFDLGALRFLADGRLLAVTGSNVDVWDVAAGTRLTSLSGTNPIVSADESTLYVTSSGIMRYSLADYTNLGNLPLPVTSPAGLSSFQIAPNGSVKTTLDTAGVLRVWCSP